MFDLYACNPFLYTHRAQNPNPRTRKGAIFITRCTIKPDTNRDNATENSTIEPNTNVNMQNPGIPISNQELTASNPRSLRGLVFDMGSKNSWDSVEIGSPVVRRFLSDEEERWYMWYYGRSSGSQGLSSIGLAVSSNGIHWERGEGAIESAGDVGLVMNSSKDWWAFDTQSVMPCEVVIMSSAKIRAGSAVYWLYYTGFCPETVGVLENSLEFSLGVGIGYGAGDGDGGFGKVFKSLPGLAMSQDGRHWARIEGEHHSGALIDVGADGEWDSMFIASPQVVFHGSGDLRMYYHSFDVVNREFAVGMARSRDGIRWVKLGKIIGGGGNGNFDECGVVNARVVRDRKDGKYVMAYEGVDGYGRRSIGLAQSTDGLKDWKRIGNGPVLKLSEDGWDDKGVGSPCLVQMDGEADEWRLYYRGIGKVGGTGIGMAVSEGKDSRKFRRWTGFHL